MEASSLVVRRCVNCGQEYDLHSLSRECGACYQPLGYWCTKDSEASGSWLTGPECPQCVKREERNKKRRESRKRKKTGSEEAAETNSLFEGLVEEPQKAAEVAVKSLAPASSASKVVFGGGRGSSPPAPEMKAEPDKSARKPSPVSDPASHIAAAEHSGVVRRCMNCGTEFTPGPDATECGVCFGGLGWWCRTHSPAGGAWLSGTCCPLCVAAPPTPVRPKRPPILGVPTRRQPPPVPRAAPVPTIAEPPYFTKSLWALALLYLMVYAIGLSVTPQLSTDFRLMVLGAVTVAGGIALWLRITPVIAILATVAVLVGTTWLVTIEPIAAVVFLVFSLISRHKRFRLVRPLAVAVCYLAIGYGLVGDSLKEMFIYGGRLSLRMPGNEIRSGRVTSPAPSPARDVIPGENLLPDTLSTPMELDGHSAKVYSVAYLPDGKSLLSLGHDNTLYTWNTETGARLKSFNMEPHSAALYYDYSPEGDLLAEVRSADPSELMIWNSRNNVLIRSLRMGSPIAAVSFSPSGTSLILGKSDGTVGVIDVASGREQHSFRAHVGQPVNSVAMAASQNICSATGPKGIGFWNMAELSPEEAPTKLAQGRDANHVLASQFVNDTTLLMTVSAEPTVSTDLVVRYWDALSGTLIKTLRSDRTVPASSCAIRNDGRQIACGSRADLPGNSSVYLYNLN